MEPLPSEPQETSERIGRSLVPQLYVHIEIWDQGPGIPAKERRRLARLKYRQQRAARGGSTLPLPLTTADTARLQDLIRA